jgi:hypothetical protein
MNFEVGIAFFVSDTLVDWTMLLLRLLFVSDCMLKLPTPLHHNGGVINTCHIHLYRKMNATRFYCLQAFVFLGAQLPTLLAKYVFLFEDGSKCWSSITTEQPIT